MRVFFDRELDNVATFWRVFRRDGVTLGFTSHDRDLYFSGIVHQSAPGMVPSAIRRTINVDDDDAEVEGALSHDSIRADELATGLYDAASIEIGAVDWEALDHHVFYNGKLGTIEDDNHSFSAQLKSAKAILEEDLVPRTSPTCRAEFCGKGCSLSAATFTSLRSVSALDLDANSVQFPGITMDDFIDGQLRFLDGPQTGLTFGIVASGAEGLTLDRPLVAGTAVGTMVELREGCDHTFASCQGRFGNAENFRGEPFLPGNDLLARYGKS